MKIVLCIALLLVSSLSFKFIPSFNADSDKVKVDLYYESLCPDCQQFISRSLKVAAGTKDFWKICDLNLYPYGNARRTQNGSSWSFTCQHGPKECQGNLIQTCAIRKFDFYTKALPFVICLEGNSTDWVSSGQKCASTYGLDWTSIYQCSQGQEGIKYEVQVAKATEVLSPAHTYVPWIVVNNQHTTSAQNAVIANMVRYVCSIYRGPQKIDACK